MTTTTTLPAVRLDRIHNAAGPLGQALRAVPGWLEALAHWERANRFAPDSGRVSALDEVSALVTAALDDDTADAAHLIEQAAAAVQRETAASLLAQATYAARQEAASALDAAIAVHPGAIFASLNAQLRELLDEAAPVFAQLKGIDTADAAIKAGAADAWREVDALERHYAAIRMDAGRIWPRFDNHGRHLRQSVVSYIRNPQAVDPDFVERRAGRLPAAPQGHTTPDAPDWPDFWDGSALRWCVEHPEAEPWVPSPDELDEVESELRAEARQRYLESERGTPVKARGDLRTRQGVA